MSAVSMLFIALAAGQYFEDEGDAEFSPIIKETSPEPFSDPLSPPSKPNFYLETSMLCLLLLFLSNYFKGKHKNFTIAKEWFHMLKPLFQENFSQTGAIEKEGDEELMKDANHVYKYYATGRYNLGYVLGTLELAKRQDLFNTVFVTPFTKSNDRASYEIPIKQESPNPAVFVLCKTSQVKTLRADHTDVRTLTKVFEVSLPGQYTLLAENSETVDFVFNSNVLRLISSLGNTIDSIYVSDQVQLISGYSTTLSAIYLYPKDGKDIDLIPIQAQLAITLADLVSKLSLSAKLKETAEKERNTMNKEKIKEIKQQREEERLQKKLEKKKKDDEKLQGLSKEKKRKLEEKEYKKELKKKNLKFKTIKG